MLTLRKDPRFRAHFLEVDGFVSPATLRGILLRLRRSAGEPRHQGLLIRLVSVEGLPLDAFWHELSRGLREVEFDGPVAVVSKPRGIGDRRSVELPRVRALYVESDDRLSEARAWLESEVLAPPVERDAPTPPHRSRSATKGRTSVS